MSQASAASSTKLVSGGGGSEAGLKQLKDLIGSTSTTHQDQKEERKNLLLEQWSKIEKRFKEDTYLKLFVENNSSSLESFDVSTYLKNKLKEDDEDQTSMKSSALDLEIMKLHEGITAIDNQIFEIFEKQSTQLEEDEGEFKKFLSSSIGEELKQAGETDMSLVHQYQNVISGKGLYKSVYETQNLETDLATVKRSVESLQNSVGKLQSSLGTSYSNLNSRYKQLYNMFETTELMKKVYSFLSLVSKLKKGYNGYSSDQTNLLNVSLYIYELGRC